MIRRGEDATFDDLLARDPRAILDRAEIFVAKEWAQAVHRDGGKIIVRSSCATETPRDERDWRRAWIQIRAAQQGRTVQILYYDRAMDSQRG